MATLVGGNATNKWPYLCWSDADKERILKRYDRDAKSSRADVDSIRDWLAKQPHLKQYDRIGDNAIELMLILNKFRIEQTKKRIDAYFSIRPFFPEFFAIMDNERLANITKATRIVPLRRLRDGDERIIICKLTDQSYRFDACEFFAYVLKLTELRLACDCCDGDCVVLDFDAFGFAHASQITPTFLKRMVTVMESVYALRARSIYVVNAPKAVDRIVTLFKSFVKPKIADRIHTCTGTEVLRDLIADVDELPSDYGGRGRSTAETADSFVAKMGEIDAWLRYLRENPVDESARPDGKLTGDRFGIEGNFRRLDVD